MDFIIAQHRHLCVHCHAPIERGEICVASDGFVKRYYHEGCFYEQACRDEAGTTLYVYY